MGAHTPFLHASALAHELLNVTFDDDSHGMSPLPRNPPSLRWRRGRLFGCGDDLRFLYLSRGAARLSVRGHGCYA